MATNEHINLDEENGVALIATAITLLVLSWTSVGLRSYTRVWLMNGMQLDDWLMLVAQVYNLPTISIQQNLPSNR